MRVEVFLYILVMAAVTYFIRMLPLTLIASIWGMNVGIPGEGSTHAFWAILGLMVVVLVTMVAFFRRRRWL